MAHQHNNINNIKTVFFLNLGFTVLEIIGGFLTNSLAILSDAVHDLGDSFSLGLTWYLENYSKKGRDKNYSYGYRRFSLLGAFITAIVLIGGSIAILSEAVPRIIEPERSHAPGMVFFAVIGIAVNGLAAFKLRAGKTMNARLVVWHLLEDVLGWIAVLIVGTILLFKEIYVLDPILSILVTLYVLYNMIRNLRKTSSLFLQATPENVDLPEIEKKIVGLDKVESIHHAHTWSLDGEIHVFTTHIVVNENTTQDEASQVKHEIKAMVADMGFEHVTLEIEYPHEKCRMRDHE